MVSIPRRDTGAPSDSADPVAPVRSERHTIGPDTGALHTTAPGTGVDADWSDAALLVYTDVAPDEMEARGGRWVTTKCSTVPTDDPDPVTT